SVAALPRQRLSPRDVVARLLRAPARRRAPLRPGVLGDGESDSRRQRVRPRHLRALGARDVRPRAALHRPARGAGGGLLLRLLPVALRLAGAFAHAGRAVLPPRLPLHGSLARDGAPAGRRAPCPRAHPPGPQLLLPRLRTGARVRTLSPGRPLALAV